MIETFDIVILTKLLHVSNIIALIYLFLNLPDTHSSFSLINPLSQVHVWFSPHILACSVPVHWMLASHSSSMSLLPVMLYFGEYIVSMHDKNQYMHAPLKNILKYVLLFRLDLLKLLNWIIIKIHWGYLGHAF